MGCPNSNDGTRTQGAGNCMCPEHDPGLSVHAQDPIAYEAALARCRPTTTRLSVVTLGPSAEPTPCTDTMTCTCADCGAATAFLIKRGGIGAGNASPFKTRRAA